MAEPIKYNLSDAALADGTIDFYALLAESPNADIETLRAKIQGLYSESQANRDHRNLSKRREYQTLLELLPAARAALLEPPKREKYDKYLAAARAGTPPTDFETFINDLMGFGDDLEEKTGLLGVQEKAPSAPVAPARPVPVPSPSSNSRPAPKPAPVAPVRTPTAPPKAPLNISALVGGVGGIAIGLVIGLVIIKELVPAILLGIILGAVGFVALNRQPRLR